MKKHLFSSLIFIFFSLSFYFNTCSPHNKVFSLFPCQGRGFIGVIQDRSNGVNDSKGCICMSQWTGEKCEDSSNFLYTCYAIFILKRPYV